MIYNLEHGIKFERNTDVYFSYIFNGNEHKYFPDFVKDGIFVEIKGYTSKQWNAKINSLPQNVKIEILYRKEIKPYIDYVVKKYGKDFIRLYEKRI